MNFKKWLENFTIGTDNVNSQIDGLYDKARYAIKLVQLYVKSSPVNKDLLKNISTIAPLNSSVYGLYNSAENKALIPNDIRFKFDKGLIKNNNDIQKLPYEVIKQHIPDIDEKQIKPTDMIRVNVQKIVRELGDTPNTVIEIASTIVHEATHEKEYRTTGKTDENGPKKAEKEFKDWVSKNWNNITNQIPQINFISNKAPN